MGVLKALARWYRDNPYDERELLRKTYEHAVPWEQLERLPDLTYETPSRQPVQGRTGEPAEVTTRQRECGKGPGNHTTTNVHYLPLPDNVVPIECAPSWSALGFSPGVPAGVRDEMRRDHEGGAA